MKSNHTVFLLVIIFLVTGCSKTPLSEEQKRDSGLIIGADVSWITEMEEYGYKFYNGNGEIKECITLLKDLGFNAIRLRVWVNPANGWCNKDDVLTKAKRANNQKMNIMLNFHYSDSWADPGKQNKPQAWSHLNINELASAVTNHTTEVLSLMKLNNIDIKWIQVGNETGNGMMWPDGMASSNMAGYALLNNAGYDAVKSVFPNATVIVHLQEGNRNDLYRWLFDGLKANGGKWDMIGMSLYPSVDDFEERVNELSNNINDMVLRYATPVMICETGMPWDSEEEAARYLKMLVNMCKTSAKEQCKGIFYWEPQSYNNWKGYTLGAFNLNGRPTKALTALTSGNQSNL